MKNIKNFNGFAVAFTEKGPIYYCYDNKKIDMKEFIEIEYTAQVIAMKKRHHLFSIYDTSAISYIAVGLN